MKLPEITMRLPKLSTRTVWIGAYGGHFDIIMIFSGKPTLSTVYHDDPEYLTTDPKLVATTDPQDWMTWFGPLDFLSDIGILEKREDGSFRPLDTECRKVVRIKLTAVWKETSPGRFEPIGLSYYQDH